MTLDELTRDTSPYLLHWINLAIAPRTLTIVYDLKKVKRLEGKNFPVPYSDYTQKKLSSIQNDLKSKKGDWALLGELTSLQVLEFPKRIPPRLIDDYSFLPRLKNLQRLDLQYTSFTDCSLLSGLTQLKRLNLPSRKKLIHTEALDLLSCSINMDEPSYQDDNFPPYKIIPKQETSAPIPDTFAIHCLEYGRKHLTDNEITQEAIDELANLIRKGKIDSVFLSIDEDAEENFFTMDIENGWAAPALNTCDENGNAIYFNPINEKYDSVEDDAPVEAEGQSPVPKRFALDDLDLASECVTYFARTGKLYPGISWAEFT